MINSIRALVVLLLFNISYTISAQSNSLACAPKNKTTSENIHNIKQRAIFAAGFILSVLINKECAARSGNDLLTRKPDDDQSPKDENRQEDCGSSDGELDENTTSCSTSNGLKIRHGNPPSHVPIIEERDHPLQQTLYTLGYYASWVSSLYMLGKALNIQIPQSYLEF